MLTRNNLRTQPLLLVAAALLMGLTVLAGCSDDDPVSPATTAGDAYLDEDSAESVATGTGADTGGLMDQVSDLVTFAESPDPAAKDGIPGMTVVAVYDNATGEWTITLTRERGFPDGPRYAYIERVYRLKYLNELGEPQQYRIVGVDSARTMEFGIVSGAGEHHTPWLDQHLISIEGSLVATGLNTDFLTINGTYARSGENTIIGRAFERTVQHSMAMELIDVVAPADYEGDLSLAVSGIIEGSSTSDISGVRGGETFSVHVERDFSIDLAEGVGEIHLGGRTFRTLLNVGDLIE